MKMRRCAVAICVMAGLGLGCAGRPSMFPNHDAELRRTSAQFAADAVKLHPYHADAPRGGEALGRSMIDYTFKTVEVFNYSDEDWDDVQLWINKNYVVGVPKIAKGRERTLQLFFTMFYDDSGNYFVTEGGKKRVDSLEMYRGGKMYTIPLGLAD